MTAKTFTCLKCREENTTIPNHVYFEVFKNNYSFNENNSFVTRNKIEYALPKHTMSCP